MADTKQALPEYLGDIDIADAFLAQLTNTNTAVNKIGKVPRGSYTVTADWNEVGELIQLRLEPQNGKGR